MKIGDIVRHQEKYWKLVSLNREFRTGILLSFDGSKEEVPDDLDQGEELKVLCNPADSWPFTSVPVKIKAGPVKRVSRGSILLRPMLDWVPSDFLRPGGAIFFNPALQLRTGEILVAGHEDGSLSRITITRGFGTVRRKKARTEKKPAPKPVTVYDRLGVNSLFKDLK